MGQFRYKAFISYSHHDQVWAQWLHRRLESYRFPKNIRASRSDIPARLSPIFRDREELSAGHDLSIEIEAALRASETLIVICSPAAARSHWVNEEVLYFKRQNRAAQIFCLIVDGDAFAEDPAQEAFPPAIRFHLNDAGALSDRPAEPLAADLRDAADGRRLGVFKLIAGMVGLRTDDLVQRDMQRARRRVTAITVSAAVLTLAMGMLTLAAIQGQAAAEQRRNDAEGQIEFMLTELRTELESVGRLDALQSVGERAVSYYAGYPLSDHDDDAMGRRARVFHYLGEVQDSLGQDQDAARYFGEAYSATEALLARKPKDAQTLFNHSQSAYWVGYAAWNADDLPRTQTYFEEYLSLIQAYQRVSTDPRLATIELSNAYANLGVFHGRTQDFPRSLDNFARSRDILLGGLDSSPNDAEYKSLLSDTYGWLSTIHGQTQAIDKAVLFRRDEIAILQNLRAGEGANPWELGQALGGAHRNLARLHVLSGDLSAATAAGQIGLGFFEELVAHDPTNIKWRYSFARTQALMVETYRRAGQGAELARMRAALAVNLDALGPAGDIGEAGMIAQFELTEGE